MLRKNLDVTKGLVNGSMGTLIDVVYDKHEAIQLLTSIGAKELLFPAGRSKRR